MNEFNQPEQQHQPIFNVPNIILLLAASFILIHAIRTYVLSPQTDLWVIGAFSFIPASFGPLYLQLPVPESWMWSSISYAFLHGDWTHLIVNIVWMFAFGAPVAMRFGWLKFILLTILTSIGGAVVFYLFNVNGVAPVIGASGAVSGYMGAASRFVFSGNGFGKRFNATGPALSLFDCLKNRQFIIFFAIWMVINFIFGQSGSLMGGAGIAWEAHLGGFLTGILSFSLFER